MNQITPHSTRRTYNSILWNHTTELSEPNYTLNKNPVQYDLNQNYFELEPTTVLHVSETNHIMN